MGNEAWEKAVEAGARAGSPAAFDAKNFVGVPHRREVAERFAQVSAERTLRAAFPILAEELVREVEARAKRLRATTPDRFIGEDASMYDEPAAHFEAAASALRARIEQMKEQS